jgi:hypothetical protein
MDRDGQLLSAVASFPKGICTCCLVERCGLTHSYVLHLCNQLRSDGKLKPLDVNVLREYVDHRRKQQPEERCSVCGKDWPYGLVFHPLGQEVDASTKDKPAFNWQEMCLAERICEELPNKDKFQCVDSAWLNAQRRIIIGLLKKIAPQRSGEKIRRSISFWATPRRWTCTSRRRNPAGWTRWSINFGA